MSLPLTERPLPFSTDMVRATLRELDPKTQTRRVIVPQPEAIWGSGVAAPQNIWGLRSNVFGAHGRIAGNDRWIYCPYGMAGDRLWVRESWRALRRFDSHRPRNIPAGSMIAYVASEPYTGDLQESPAGRMGKARPGMFMMRWMSRITLEVTEIRVERLQDITEEDAKAEGVEPNCDGTHVDECPPCQAAGQCQAKGEYIRYGWSDDVDPALSARESYQSLWDSLNEKRGYSWASNPWVWVIGFRRI